MTHYPVSVDQPLDPGYDLLFPSMNATILHFVVVIVDDVDDD